MRKVLFILFLVFPLTGEGFIPVPDVSTDENDKIKYSSLLHINSDDRLAVEFLETRFSSPYDSFSILPRNFYDTVKRSDDLYRIRPFLKGVDSESFWQILSTAGVEYYYSNRPGNIIAGSAGKRFMYPSTFVMTQSGNMVLFDALAFYWELREENYFDSSSSWDSFSVDFNRVYAKLRLWMFSVMGGKDTIHLGPGEYGMIMSSNADPFWMITIKNEETVRLWGSWNFMIMKGWLNEEREDVSDPEIFAMRMTYRPQGLFDFFELGMTRTMIYSGRGKYKYRASEYPMLISGIKDNDPFGKYDADSYGAIDFTFNIPFYLIIPDLKVFKFYYQEGGTDITAFWQIDNWGSVTLPYLLFKFYSKSYLLGIFAGTEDDAIRLEYSKTSRTFYSHHLYPVEGYSYGSMSLGHPLGRNHQALRFNHRHWFNNSFSLKWEVGFYQLPGTKESDHDKYFFAIFPLFSLDEGLIRRGYFSLWADWIIKGHILRGYFSLDGGTKHDENLLPTQIKINDESTIDFILGLSFLLRF